MLNYREIHKNYLVQYINQIQFDGKNLPAFPRRTIAEDLPYIFITSAETEYVENDARSSMYDNHTYMRKLNYNLNLVYLIGENVEEFEISEDSIDVLEQLIMDKFENQDVRNCMIANGVNPWTNLIFTRSSAPLAGEEINLPAGHLVKVFFIEIWQLVPTT